MSKLQDFCNGKFTEYKESLSNDNSDKDKIKVNFAKEILDYSDVCTGKVCNILNDLYNTIPKTTEFIKKDTKPDEILDFMDETMEHDYGLNIKQKKNNYIDIEGKGDIKTETKFIATKIIETFSDLFNIEDNTNIENNIQFKRLEGIISEMVENTLLYQLGISGFYTPVNDNGFAREIFNVKFKTLCMFNDRITHIYAKLTSANSVKIMVFNGFPLYTEQKDENILINGLYVINEKTTDKITFAKEGISTTNFKI